MENDHGFIPKTPEERAEGHLNMIKFLFDSKQPDTAVTAAYPDTLTPSLYDDPHRSCTYYGTVIEYGEDERYGPWAKVIVTSHTLMGPSPYTIDPEFAEDLAFVTHPDNLKHGETPEDAIEQFFLDFAQKHPETVRITELEPPIIPHTVYLREVEDFELGIRRLGSEG